MATRSNEASEHVLCANGCCYVRMGMYTHIDSDGVALPIRPAIVPDLEEEEEMEMEEEEEVVEAAKILLKLKFVD